MLEHTTLLITGDSRQSQLMYALKGMFEQAMKANQLENEVGIMLSTALIPGEEPMVVVIPDGTCYQHLEKADVDRICTEHLIGGKMVESKAVKDAFILNKIRKSQPYQFHAKQKRIALRNCGKINPLDIEEYIANDGYLALADILLNKSPQEVIDEVIASGLRGRGGGGFPTGKKWQFAKNQQSEQKYVICNADEGDPGAFMDRAILEGDPHSVLEAMAICGYAIGANQGYIYVRAEYPVAVERLTHAIKQARAHGFLGTHVLDTSFSFDIDLRLGAGAFVCGEETALIASIEGERGMPRLKPPFPAVKGLWGMPTNVNNVETFANVPVIFLKGSSWFKSIGTKASSGTKVFALGGKINHTGLVEVPMGTTLRDIVFEIGGGIPNKRKFKAIQTGGPSGGCITEKDLDTPIDYENLTALGSMMGSGGMIIMDEDNCMVDVARFYLDFTVDESCGKCTPCREGTKQMKDILDRICEGYGTMKDIDELDRLAHMIQETSLCGLGQTAPNPVISTLKHFKDEYIAHVVDRACPAGVCRELTNFIIDDTCIGCTKCARNCPVNAIHGWPKQLHSIDLNLCIRCGACKIACPVHAISSQPLHQEVFL